MARRLLVLAALWLVPALAYGQDPTRTPYYGSDMFIDDFAAFTATVAPTGTTTPSPTPSPTQTRTPTVFGCQAVQVIGILIGPDGNPAVDRRVSVTVPTTELVNVGCTLHPGTVVYHTTATGQMPSTAKVVGGSRVNISLQNGGPVCVDVPTGIAQVEINDLLRSGCGNTPTRTPGP